LPIPQKLYEVTKRLKTREEEVEWYLPGFMVFTDCTEQFIPRPKNRIRKETCAIPARERSTQSRISTANQKGFLIYKTKYKHRGRRHDYRITKRIIRIYQRI
jgi:hypothetical protein